MRTRIRVVSALVLGGVLAMSGCGNGDNSGSSNRNDQFAQLMQRPDLEQVSSQFDDTRRAVAEQLSQQFNLPEWTIVEGRGSESGCGREFHDIGLDGAVRSLDTMIARAPIADENWDRALEIANSVTSRNGFGPPMRLADKPGNHQAEFHDAFGGRLVVGTQVNTILSVRTGCHLTPQAHQRGAPPPAG